MEENQEPEFFVNIPFRITASFFIFCSTRQAGRHKGHCRHHRAGDAEVQQGAGAL
jgi:hypothetical protein